MRLGALGRKFRWQAWKDWPGKKKIYIVEAGKNGEEDTEPGQRDTWQRNLWAEKDKPEGQTWGWK